jgi:hypothetical protein
MRTAFKHQFAEGMVLYEEISNGTRVPQTLIVAAAISLDRNAVSYDEQKFAELNADVAEFVKRNEIAHVQWVQGAIRL